MMGDERHVVIVPGLSDDPRGLVWLTRKWVERHHLIPHIVRFGWQGDVGELGPKLARLGEQVDRLVDSGRPVSLLGTSAGASAVLNTFFARTREIDGVISVCGRLRRGQRVYPSLDHSRNRPLFKASVLRCEAGLESLDACGRRKILTIRPFHDEFVPVTTMTVEGATNRRIVAVEHMLGIYMALSIYAGIVVDFLGRAAEDDSPGLLTVPDSAT